MLFQLTILATKLDKTQQTLAFLLEWNDASIAKDFCANYKFILLSLNIFNWTKELFGNVEIKTIWNDIEVNLIFDTQERRENVKFLTESGIECVDVKMIKWWEIENAQSELKEISQKIKDELIIIEKNKDEELEKQSKIYNDEQLQKIQEMTNSTLTEIDDLIAKTQTEVSTFKVKKLKEQQEELRKLRMWTNVNKIMEVLESVFWLMQDIDLEFLESQKKTETKLIWQSEVMNTDVETEVSKYEKSKKVQESWVNKNYDDSYYIFMWKAWIYQRFLQKDFLWRLKDINKVFGGLLSYIEYFALIVIIQFAAIIDLSMSLLPNPQLEEYLLKILIISWIWWFIAYILKFFRNKSVVTMILMSIIWFVCWYYLQEFVIKNFAV